MVVTYSSLSCPFVDRGLYPRNDVVKELIRTPIEAFLNKDCHNVMFRRMANGFVFESYACVCAHSYINGWKKLHTHTHTQRKTKKYASTKPFGSLLTITYRCGNMAHFV